MLVTVPTVGQENTTEVFLFPMVSVKTLFNPSSDCLREAWRVYGLLHGLTRCVLVSMGNQVQRRKWLAMRAMLLAPDTCCLPRLDVRQAQVKVSIFSPPATHRTDHLEPVVICTPPVHAACNNRAIHGHTGDACISVVMVSSAWCSHRSCML